MSTKGLAVRLISFIILSAMTFLGFVYLYNNTTSQFSRIAQASFDANHGYQPVDMEYFDRLAKRINNKYVSFTCEEWRFDLKDTEVTPVYTTYSYFQLTNTDFLYGKGFGEAQQYAAQPLAVISEELALRLYMKKDVVGESIDIDGKYYTVCGVVKNQSDFMSRLSTDSRERVYLPYTCAPHINELEIDSIVYDTASNSAAIVEQMDLPQYYFFSLSEKSEVLETLWHLLLLVLFLGVSVFVIKLCFRLCKYYLNLIVLNLKDNYLLKSVRTIPLIYFLLLLFSVIVPALIIVIFIKSDFSIYIVAEYIPYDNIFDLGFYFSAFLSHISQINSLALAGDNYYFHLYNLTFSNLCWLLAVFIPLMVFVLTSIWAFLCSKIVFLNKN